MALPAQLTFQQILGQSMSSLMGTLGLQSIKVAGPLLTVLETASTADFRNSQNSFNLLAQTGLDFATGNALDRLGAEVKCPRLGSTFGTASVNFTDSSITKISTFIYPGGNGIPAGSSTVNVTSDLNFPATGNIYLGRGTINVEGPLAYTSISSGSGFFTFNLSSPTKYFHNVNESVVLGQNGFRVIQAGTIVGVPPNTNTQSVTYKTLYSATIPDGETFVSGVQAVCQIAGSVGNTPDGTITNVVSSLFAGATVTNPLPVSNALDAQNDTQYRESIRLARQNIQKGTNSAIVQSVIGITSSAENKTIVSASIQPNSDGSETLYIDDGTGYEEVDFGIGFESIVPDAQGGESIFKLNTQPPVSKAKVFSVLSAPFNIPTESSLTVIVGGISTEHTFEPDDFNSISSASAYEVCDSINSDSNILWSARPYNNASQVAIFPSSNEDMSIQVVPSVDDANVAFGFPGNVFNTLNLYLNDTYLYENGLEAQITSNPTTLWSNAIGSSGSETLIISVDNTPSTIYTFTAADFVNNNTGFYNIGPNSPQAWAKVINARVPGITAQVSGLTIVITSNAGNSSNAGINIAGTSSLVVGGMFNPLDLIANGKNNDYQFNRNNGEISLTKALAVNDVLTAGSFNTQGYLDSALVPNPSSIVFSTTPYWWISLDGEAKNIPVQLGNAWATVSITQPYGVQTAGIDTPCIIRVALSDTNIFNDLLVGDYVIVWDSNLTGLTFPVFSYLTGVPGMIRISNLDYANYQWFEFECPFINTSFTPVVTALAQNGVAFCRTNTTVQQLSVNSGTYTLDTLATALNNILLGAFATNFNNLYLRLSTNTALSEGNILMSTANVAGQVLNFPLAQEVVSSDPSLPYIESGSLKKTTPLWDYFTTSANSASSFVIQSNDHASENPVSLYDSGREANWLKSFPGEWIKITNAAYSAPSTTFTTSVTVPSNIVVGQYIYVFGPSKQTLGPITAISTNTITATGDYGTLGSISAMGNAFSVPYPVALPSLSGLVNTNGITYVTLTLPAGGIGGGLVNGMYVKIVNALNSVYDGTFGPITVTSSNGLTFNYAQVLPSNTLSSGGGNMVPIQPAGWSTNSEDTAQIATRTPGSYSAGDTLTLRADNSMIYSSPSDRLYFSSAYAVSPNDNIDIFMNNNVNTNYNVNMFRDIVPNTAAASDNTYGQTIAVLDADNNNAQLAAAFTTAFTFEDFALYMSSRTRSHDSTQVDSLGSPPGTPDVTSYSGKTVLWRFARLGPDGDGTELAYTYPSLANQGVSVTTNNATGTPQVDIVLPTGALRTGIGFASSNVLIASGNSNYVSNSSINSFTPSGGNTVVNVNGIVYFVPNEIVQFLDGSTNEGFYKVVSVSYPLTSGAYSTTNITVVGAPSNSSTVIRTANYANRVTAGTAVSLISGLDVPAGDLQTPTFNINSIVGNGTIVTVQLQPVSTGFVQTDPSGTTQWAYYNPPISTTYGATGNQLFGATSSTVTDLNSYVTINGVTGDPGGINGSTFKITTGSFSLSGGNIQFTFPFSTTFGTVSTGTATPNTVVALPTMPVASLNSLLLTPQGDIANYVVSSKVSPFCVYVNNFTGSSIDPHYSTALNAFAFFSNLGFSYIDTGVTVPATSNSVSEYTGMFTAVQFPNVASATQLQFSGNVLAGDVINILNSNDIIPTPNSVLTLQPYRVCQVGNQFVTFLCNPSSALNLSTAMSNILTFSKPSSGNFPITFYPMGISGTPPTVSQILAAVDVAPYDSIVTGTAVADPSGGTPFAPGAGTIYMSTDAEFAMGTSLLEFYTMSDGINYVSSSNLTSLVSTLTLKNPVSSFLSVANNYNDWAGETMKLVPITNYSIVNYLNSAAVSGLLTAGSVLSSDNAFGIEISSITPGSAGSVQIASGTANDKVATVLASALASNTNGFNRSSIVTTSSSDAIPFSAQQWVKLESANDFPKTLNKINFTTQNPTTFQLFAGPTAVSNNLSIDREVVSTFSGSSASYKVALLNQSGLIQLVISGLANPTWSNLPQVGDILVIPSGSAIAGAGSANVGSYLIISVSPTVLTLLLTIPNASPALAVNIGPVVFSATPSHDLYVLSPAVYAPIGTALLLDTGAGDALGMISQSIDGEGYARTIGNIEWQIEKFGDYMGYTATIRGQNNPTAIFSIPGNTDETEYNTGEGGWVNIQLAGASVQNQGLFQVVRTQCNSVSYDQPWAQYHQMFFVHNPNGVEEVVQQIDNSSFVVTEVDSNKYFSYQGQDYIDFYSFDSILPGDTLNLNLPLTTGAGNWSGQWSVVGFAQPNVTVSTIGNTSIGGTPSYTAIAIVPAVQSTAINFLPGISSPAITVPNTSYIQAACAQPLSLYKKILNISPNPNGATTLTDFILDTCNLWDRVSQYAGFTMTALDKLEFTTDFIQGLDAYKVATGIIAAANQRNLWGPKQLNHLPWNSRS